MFQNSLFVDVFFPQRIYIAQNSIQYHIFAYHNYPFNLHTLSVKVIKKKQLHFYLFFFYLICVVQVAQYVCDFFHFLNINVCLIVPFLLTIVLYVIRLTVPDYPLHCFKLFSKYMLMVCTHTFLLI